MPRGYDTLYNWVRETTRSFVRLRFVPWRRDARDTASDGLIYRLRRWPDLPSYDRTADIFRALSVMSQRPINRRWILANSKMRAAQVDQLLRRLVDEGAIEVINGSGFAALGTR
jgi:hypothetical protein